MTRSREDQQAFDVLESKTTRVEVNGTIRYAPMDAIVPRLRGLEKCLLKDPESLAGY